MSVSVMNDLMKIIQNGITIDSEKKARNAPIKILAANAPPEIFRFFLRADVGFPF